jgi:hypothetical protein
VLAFFQDLDSKAIIVEKDENEMLMNNTAIRIVEFSNGGYKI